MQEVAHTTTLKSFSMPAFRHPPIWKDEPENEVTIEEGQNASVKCAATVGPQYDSYRMQPVRVAWLKYDKVKFMRVCTNFLRALIPPVH